VLTPSHDSSFFLTYVASTLKLAGRCAEIGMSIDFLFQSGDSLVTRARNYLVARFLANPHWTHAMWIDADIGFSPEALFRLLLSDHDVACGVYPLKREDWPVQGVPAGTTQPDFDRLYTSYPVQAGHPNDPELTMRIDTDGFMPVRYAPTGFMCVKRAVFERMMTAFPDLRFTPDMVSAIDPRYYYRFFDVTVEPETKRYLSEDYGFCRLWEQLGGTIHVDANSNLAHQGSKIYRGDFGGSIRQDICQAVVMPHGVRYRLDGLLNIAPNPPGPI
jgi:hypothetical protein